MKTDEIRQRFIDFFTQRGHRPKPSDVLVPRDDPTLLFTGAGMNQFKDEFYGRGEPGLKRAVTSQKCLRTGDIENVGRTASHHTFFEMLGNFSFGDYFKEEAITWAWEFMCDEMGVPADTMYVSVHETDEEAYGIWRNVVGLTPERIYRFDEKENYWPSNVVKNGPNGPCGPCSEIFVDRGAEIGCGRPDCDPSCDCDRFVEVWNLVFQQYDRGDGGTLTELAMQNIDTGMGLERIARVMQNVPTNFDTDLFAPTLARIGQIVGRPYAPDSPDAPMMRRIADHARAVFFCIGDGVIPSNEERGYVVRRLLRRAVRDAVQMGVEGEFMTELIEPLVASMGGPYPDLADAADHIATVVRQEERSFQRTVGRGSAFLAEHIDALRKAGSLVLPGSDVFDLYQTYGFPVEMTEALLQEQGLGLDRDGFRDEMLKHQQQSRAGASFSKAVFAEGPITRLQEKGYAPTEFTGYDSTEDEASIVGIIVGEGVVGSVEEGSQATLVLDRTPAYGESGGQEGDAGVIAGPNGEFGFTTVAREKGYFLHAGVVEQGALEVGDRVTCRVDVERRRATARNHSATHLLHHALRDVLGEHATQSGSAVSAERLRFDFSNPSAMTAEQVAAVERMVNEAVVADEPICGQTVGRDEADQMGAMALFGEKYGDRVRVVSVGGFSHELCGGTHCARTGEIGLFRIISESSVAGGVRRIEAVTGMTAYDRVLAKESLLADACAALGTQEGNLLKRAGDLQSDLRSLKRELDRARQKAASQAAVGGTEDDVEQIGDVKAVFKRIAGGSDALRAAADALRKDAEATVCLLASEDGGRLALVAALTPDLVERGLNAVDLVKAAAKVVGGGGGGRPDMAQAGGKDASKLAEAFDVARAIIREALGCA